MSLFFAVFFMQFYKLAVKETSSEGASTIILQVVAGLSILLFMPFFSFHLSDDIMVYLLLILAMVFYALNDRMQTTVRKNLDVSAYTILDQLVKVFMILYGIIIFKEDAAVGKLLGGGLILTGNVLLFYRKGKLKFNKNVILSVLASFFMATAAIIDIDISRKFNLPFYIMITLIVPAIFIYIFEKHSHITIIDEFNTSRKKHYLITGISWGMVIFFNIRALQATEVIFMAPLLATSVLLNVIIASILHKEKKGLAKKITAATIVVLGMLAMIY
jgi:drug/metabolite transporter (DMT)-like permease